MNRESVDSRFTMSGDRNSTRPSSASSIGATDGGTYVHDAHDACAPDQWSHTEDHHDDVDLVELSDEPPTSERLAEAGNVPIYDSDGNSRPFRSLYEGVEHQGQRQLLIFIRHFYCGVSISTSWSPTATSTVLINHAQACQAYVQRLCETVTPTAYFSLPIPTTITIIACGAPHHIVAHAIKTHCPFRMYAEPTRRIYKLFGMIVTLNLGRKVEYMEDNATGMVYKTTKAMLKASTRDALSAGHMFQVGGEFLFEDGEPIWCHRMRSIRGHADFRILRKVIGLPQDHLEQSTAGLLEKEGQRQGVEKSTSVMSDKPRGLRMVYESTGENGQIPKARLARESREIRP